MAAGTLGEVVSIAGTNKDASRAATGPGSSTRWRRAAGPSTDHRCTSWTCWTRCGRMAGCGACTPWPTDRGTHAAVDTGGLAALRLELVSATGPFEVPVVIDASWSRPDSDATWGGLTLRLTGTGGIADLDPFATRVGGHLDMVGNAAWIPYVPISTRCC